jgi:hypothetical protein
MAKLTAPKMFCDHFGIDPTLMSKLGVLNPTLNVDTELFIDPMLLSASSHVEMRNSRSTYETYFLLVGKFLAAIKLENDVAWKAAQRLLSFREVKGTCLGYGANSVSGSGAGPQATHRLLLTGKEIMDLGISDPDLFAATALFEDGFGPDLISDMTTNVIIADLLDFNNRILKAIGIAGEPIKIKLANGKRYDATLPLNPCFANEVPIILVPQDVLRPLPVATSWSDVSEAARENEELRQNLSEDIAHMWSRKTLEGKDKLKAWALHDVASFGMLLDMLHGHSAKPYDFVHDPLGELIWRTIGQKLVADSPLTLVKPKTYDAQSVDAVVCQIIEQFRFLIEDRRLSEELYHEDKPRPEKSAQRLFFAAAYAYCTANDLDITPEADTGNGPVDFKVSVGMTRRTLVEIKLSTNSAVVSGYEKQLIKYDEAEEAFSSYYVILDVGKIGEKLERVMELRNDRVTRKASAPNIVLIDGTRKPSASKL